MSDRSLYRCYAIRRLNPFRGIIKVLQLHSSRAISLDGRDWEIQIRAARPDDMWGAVTPGPVTYQYLRFGIWSQQQGLQRVPANPLLDLSSMLKKVDLLIDALEGKQVEMPFPLQDRHEFWLLDGSQRLPLALLASSIRPSGRKQGMSWHAADASNGDFDSEDADLIRPPHPKEVNPLPHTSALNRLVQIESGHAVGQWFERDAAGYGTGGVVETAPSLSGRTLEPAQFPELLLRRSWSDRYANALVSDYLAWTSPSLLTLQNLEDLTRKWLQRQARYHASRVNEIWPLYPREVDQAFIDAARVEARIKA